MKTIGRKDIVDFPAFELEHVPVKIDTGAYSCSIHCTSIRHVKTADSDCLEVVFLDPQTRGYTGETQRFLNFRTKIVKSSNGVAEERFFVEGNVVLFGESIETLFSLTERSGLRNPVLLGRRLLNKRFLVDTSKTKCSYKAAPRELK